MCNMLPLSCVLPLPQDPACTSYSQALLYYKGYHAIQTHRIAHALWVRGQKVMAVALQSRMSEVRIAASLWGGE
jgi:serine acetyltransferase